jgi:Domain of unknown function (DUF4190)
VLAARSVPRTRERFDGGPSLGYPNQPGWQPSAPPAPPYTPATNEMAIAALILAFVFYPLGIVFGHVARRQINQGRQGGSGLATAALIIGYLQLAVWVGLFLVAAILIVLPAR